MSHKDPQFIEDYPNTSNAKLAERYGVSTVTIKKWAWEKGLKKTHEYLSSLHRTMQTGNTISEEARRKIAATRIGKKMSDETKAKILNTKVENGTLPKGPTHPNWKGGKPWERFKDPAYVAWRNAVLKRDGYVCQDCGKQCNKNEKGLAAHHEKPYATHPELRLEVSNGTTLCRQCHMTRHGRTPAPKEKVACACGCGEMIASVDRYGRPRKYAHYHGAPKGSMRHNALLTEDDVRSIRKDNRKQHEIAAQYGISRTNVSLIKSRKKWSHIE
jgi:hypothetical protein